MSLKFPNKTLDIAKTVYIALLSVYAILREIVVLSNFIENSLFAYFFFGVGLVILGATFLWNRKYYAVPRIWLLLAFFAIGIVSVLVNFKYALFSNVKAMGWMALFLFLCYPMGANAEKEKDRNVTVFFTTSFITASVLVAVSLPMYFFNVDFTYLNENIIGLHSNQGFSHEYSRLWGVFADANTGAVYSFATLLMSLFLFSKTKSKLLKTLMIIADVLIVMYAVLSGSRTVYVVMLAAAVWIAFYRVLKLVKGKTFKKTMVSLAAGALSAVIVVLVYSGAQFSLPWAKKFLTDVTPKSVTTAVSSTYESCYLLGGVDITVENQDKNDKPSKDPSKDPSKEDPDENGVESLDRTDAAGKDDISNGRLDKWMDALELYMASPIIGASPRGISQFGQVHCPDNDISRYGYAAHNSILQVMMSTGTLGLIAVLLILLSTAVIIIKKAYCEKYSARNLAYSSMVLAFICSAMFLSDIFFNLTFGGLCFWFLLGMAHEKKGEETENCLEEF